MGITSRRVCSWTLCLLAVFPALANLPAAAGQTAATAGLTGRVTDPSGASVPNVTVSVENSDTGQGRTTQTDVSGAYALTLLPPGTYKVSFRAEGFKTAEIIGVRISVTETPVLNRVLELGAQSEQVTVEANVEGVQTATSALGQDCARTPRDFRSEFFNVFNHAQFGNPATDVALPTFGWITSTTVNPRLIQFALKYSF